MDLELATLWLAGSTVVLAVDTVAAARILVPRAPGNDITASLRLVTSGFLWV